MAEEQQTCQVGMHNGLPCGRPVYAGKECICHWDAPGKDLGLFNQETVRILRNAPDGYYDFTSFVFPKSGRELPRVFDKPVHFERAVFLGDVDFMDRTFANRASFYHAKFRGAAYFSGAVFKDKAGFNWAQFRGEAAFPRAEFGGVAGFSETRFCGRAVFSHAKFGEAAVFDSSRFEKQAVFDLAVFRGETDFTESDFCDTARFAGVRFEGRTLFVETVFLDEAQFTGSTFEADGMFLSPDFVGLAHFAACTLTRDARVVFRARLEQPVFHNVGNFRLMRLWDGSQLRFEHVSLEQCYFLETDVTKCEFVDVRWPRRSRLFRLWWRRAVADETSDLRMLLKWNPFGKRPLPVPEYYQLAQLYRDLQANLEQGYRYSEAGDFYVGEQEMIRKDKGWIRRFICMNWAYKLISLYGENFGLSLIWLVSLLLLFPVYLVFDGVFISGEYIKSGVLEKRSEGSLYYSAG